MVNYLNRFKKIFLISALMLTLMPYTSIQAESSSDTSDIESPIKDYAVNLYWKDQSGNPNKSLSYYGTTNEAKDINVTTTLILEVGDNYPQHQMEIRLPYSLWNYRDNIGAASFLDAGISNVSGSNPDVPFYYTIDSNTNELVINNYSDVAQGQKFTIDFRYQINQPNSIDLSNTELQAKAIATAQEQSIPVAKNSQTLSLTFNSYFQINQLQKTAKALYFWDTSSNPNVLPKDQNNASILGIPKDFNNFNWVQYSISYSGTLGQPITANLSDLLNRDDGGEIYAYQTGAGFDPWAGDDAIWNTDGTFTINRSEITTLQPTIVSGTLYLFVRYPKTENATYQNHASLVFTGVDNPVNPKTVQKETDVTFTWKEYQFPDEKTASSTILKEDSAENAHALDLFQLAGNNDISLKWKISETSLAYGYSNVLFDESGKALITNGLLDPDASKPGMKVEVYDDFTEWAKNEDTKIAMSNADYEYDSVAIQLSFVGTDRNNGKQAAITSDAFTQDIAQVFAVSDGSANYQLIGTLSNADYDATSASFIKEFTSLPTNTTKLKVVYTAIDKSTLILNPTMKIKADSAQLKAWNPSEITSLNIQDYAQVGNFNQNDEWLNPQTTPLDNQPVYKDNKYLQATTDVIKLTQFDPKSSSGATKSISDGVNHPNNQWISYDVSLVAADGYSAITDENLQLLKANDVGLPDTRQAKFYDLLPFGMYYLNDSVKAEPAWSYITSPTYIPNVNVETINNYKGTGRQMVIFSVDYNELNTTRENGGIFDSWSAVSAMNPYAYWGNQGYYTGFKVSFQMVLPWGNTYISDKSDKTNYFAYQKMETVLSNDLNNPIANTLLDEGKNPYPYKDMPGSLDDGSYFTDLISESGQYVFANLRNGISMLKQPDTLYNKATYSIDQIQASKVGLQKFVKSDVSPDYTAYSKSTMTPYGSNYTYKLELATSDVSFTGNMILFDVLENATIDDEAGWKGTFAYLDVSQLKLLGINPIIYYSTSAEPQLFDAEDINNHTVPKEWTTTTPANMADIKAIAVDATKDKDGNDYLFEPKTDVSVFITMNAPKIEQKEQAAFNQASYVSKLINTGEENFLETDITKVTLFERGELVKTSDIGNGTNEENAAEVQVGDIITYRIYYNPDESGTQQLFDTLPENLQLVKDSMFYNIAGEEQILVPTNETSYNATTRQLTWPTITSNQAIRYEFKALVNAPSVNKEKITTINTADLLWNQKDWKKSNPVTHKLLSRWIDIEKNAYPVKMDGTMKETADNGSQDNPYSVSPEQTIEYRLRVDATGYPDLASGKLIVSDFVPDETTLIIDSLKGEMHKSDTSSASGENSGQAIDIDGKQAVEWTLENMLPDDYAILYFRVIAPANDQTIFENTATVIDQQKKDTTTEIPITTIDEFGNVVEYQANESIYTFEQYTKQSNTTYHIVEDIDNLAFSFLKVDSEDHQILLSDAVFNVYYCDKTHQHDKTSSCWHETNASIVTSDANGKVDLGMLKTGTYMLIEKEAPKNYLLSKGYWLIDVNVKDRNIDINAYDNAVPFINENNMYLLANNKQSTPPIIPPCKDKTESLTPPHTGVQDNSAALLCALLASGFIMLIITKKKNK